MSATQIPRTALSSSAIAAVSYMLDGCLDVEFRRGTVYRYFDVPPAVPLGLLAADSKGTFFVRHIRDCFRYQRLTS
jgi:hypothetical protein